MGLLTLKRKRILEQKLGSIDAGATVDEAGFVYHIVAPSGADADTDLTIDEKLLVVDAWAVMSGAPTAGSDITVQNGASAISDTIDVSGGSDKSVFRATTIDDAQNEIAVAGTLRVATTSTGADFPGADVFVLGIKIA